jgi:hypothetical protein
MILTLLIWLLVFFTVLPYGRLTVFLISRWGGKPAGHFHLVFVFLAGLASLTLLADVISLFSPLNRVISLSFMAGALILYIVGCFRYRKWTWPTWKRPSLLQIGVLFLGGLILISILDLASRSPNNPDTAIYHAQAIHWIESYKAIPGLGNLTGRLAYDSNWLLDNALFGYAWVKDPPFHALPGLLVLLSLFYFLQGTWQLVSGKGSPSAWLKTLLIPIFFYILPSEVSSPGTDLPAILLTWLLLSESLAGIWKAEAELESRQLLLGFLSVFAATLKLSVLPLLILPGLMVLFYAHKKNLAWGLKMAALGLMVMLPWMARNVIISGYLIYPLPWLDLFNFDWKIPLGAVFAEVNSINNWARHIWIGSTQHDYSLSLQEWVPLWFKAETINRRIMAVLAGSSIIITALLFLTKPTRLWLQNHGSRGIGLVYLTTYCGCLFWFFTAPDFRFGFSFIIISILLLGYPALYFIGSIPRRLQFGSTALVVVTLLVNQAWFYQASFQPKTFNNRITLPENYMTVPTSSCQFADFKIWCAQLYDQCWYVPFPCVPRAVPEVELRGTDYEDGFRDKAPN